MGSHVKSGEARRAYEAAVTHPSWLALFAVLIVIVSGTCASVTVPASSLKLYHGFVAAFAQAETFGSLSWYPVRYPCPFTNAVVARDVSLSQRAGVGAVGVPVNPGEARRAKLPL